VVDAHAEELLVRGPEAGARLVFFRRQAGFLRFPSPWLVVPGVAWPDTLRLDVMHICDLGITARYIGTVLHRLLAAGHWGPATTAFEARVGTLRVAIRQYYREHHRAHGVRLSEIGRNLPPNLLGPTRRPFFKGKAKESRDLLAFAVGQLREALPSVPGRMAPLESGTALQDFYAVLAARPARGLPVAAHARLLVGSVRFLTAWAAAGGHTTIKHHYFMHLVEGAGHAGNPRAYSTFPDESFNRSVKRIASATGHGLAFARRVLARTSAAARA
jgi:hypothetical protein